MSKIQEIFVTADVCLAAAIILLLPGHEPVLSYEQGMVKFHFPLSEALADLVTAYSMDTLSVKIASYGLVFRRLRMRMFKYRDEQLLTRLGENFPSVQIKSAEEEKRTDHEK